MTPSSAHDIDALELDKKLADWMLNEANQHIEDSDQIIDELNKECAALRLELLAFSAYRKTLKCLGIGLAFAAAIYLTAVLTRLGGGM